MKKYIKLVRQHEEVDCGAACMSMIFNWYGKKLPIPTLRESICVDLSGSNMLGLKQTAEKYGLKAEGLEGTAEDFIESVEKNSVCLPVIARIVNRGGFEHYVVVSLISKGKVYVCDPADGRYALSIDGFSKVFLGQIMTFERTPQFVKENKCKNSAARFFKMIFRQTGLIAVVALLSLLITGIGLLGTAVFKFLVDGVLAENTDAHEGIEVFAVLITGIGIAYLIRFLVQLLRGRLANFMIKRINLPLMLGYYNHMMDLPVKFFENHKTGDLISRFNDANKVKNAIANTTLTILIDIVTVLFAGFVLHRCSPSLFIITLAILFIYTVISVLYINPLAKRSRKLMSENAEISSYFKESVDGVQTIKAFRAEKSVKERMNFLFVQIQDDGIKFSMQSLCKNALIELIASIGILVLLWVGALNVLTEVMTLGMLITYYTLLSYFLTPMQNLIELQSDIQEAIVAADRLNDVLDASIENVSQKDCTEAEGNDIRFDHVYFRYGTRRMVLKDISFEIRRGQHVALVGISGCGKTTVSKLLMGFYETESGSITIGNTNIIDMGIERLRSKIAYVPQEIFLFSASVRENLVLGGKQTDEAELEEILNACGCEFVWELPFGLDTILEENGENLSGGQRQRLAIARAMLSKPEILILDEATSNLDAASERKILGTVSKMNTEMTVLMSAHRLSTVKSCDKILVIDNGSIVQSGTHEDLLHEHGVYQSLWNTQNL